MNSKKYFITSFLGLLILGIAWFFKLLFLGIMFFPFIWGLIYRKVEKNREK